MVYTILFNASFVFFSFQVSLRQIGWERHENLFSRSSAKLSSRLEDFRLKIAFKDTLFINLFINKYTPDTVKHLMEKFSLKKILTGYAP